MSFFSYWPNVCVMVFFFLCVIAIFRPHLSIYLALPAAIMAVQMPLAFGISPTKVMIVFIFFILCMDLLFRRYTIRKRLYTLDIVSVVVYAVLILAISMGTSVDSFFIQLAPSKWQLPPLRGIGATVFWCGKILFFSLALHLIYRPNDFSKCLKILFNVLFVAMLIGNLQMIGFRFYPPLHRALVFFSVDLYGATLFTDSNGNILYRMSSILGEPRAFGFGMGLAVAIFVMRQNINITDFPRWMTRLWLFVAFFFGMFMSLSVSSMTIGLVALAILFVWIMIRTNYRYNYSRRQNVKRSLQLFLIGIAIFGIFRTYMPGAFERVTYYLDRMGIINEQGKISLDSLSMESEYSVYLSWLRAEPVYALFGSGLGNSGFHAMEYTSPNFTFSGGSIMLGSRSQFLEIIASLGIIGTSLLFFIWFKWWRWLGQREKNVSQLCARYIHFIRGLILFNIVHLITWDTVPIIWFLFGAGFALIYKDKTRNLLGKKELEYPFRARSAIL